MITTSPLKAKPLRNPGQSLDEELDRLINDQAAPYILGPLLVWMIAAFEWFGRWRALPRKPALFAVLALIASGVSFWRLRQLRRVVRRVKQGRDGERAVGQFLEGLRVNGARILHDIVAEGFNLDHVVISERGVFLIETKTWSKRSPESRIRAAAGRLYKEGHLTDPNPITQAIAEADWLERMLGESTGKSIRVWPVVVFPGWFVEPMDAETKAKAWVLEPKALPAWIEKEPVRLTPEAVALAAYHLSRYVRAA